MNGQVVALDLGANGGFQRIKQLGQAQVCDLAASVAKQVIVRLGGELKKIGGSVDVGAQDHVRLVHGVEIVVNGCHGNAGHFKLGEKKDLVGAQVAIRLL